MFKVKYYKHTKKFYEQFRIQNGEIHITQSAAFAAYLSSIGGQANRVWSYPPFIEALFPHWHHPYTEVYIRSLVRDYVHRHAPKEKVMYFEKRLDDFYASVRFLAEIGPFSLSPLPSLKLNEEQRFFIGMMETLRSDNVLLEYWKARAHLSRKSVAEALGLEDDAHVICVHHVDYIDAPKMLLFYLLAQVGFDVVFYIPFNPGAPNLYKTWRDIYRHVSNDEGNWECVEESQPLRGAKFAQYVDASFSISDDSFDGINFLSFAHPTDLKNYLERCPIEKERHEVLATYEEELNVYVGHHRNSHFYASRYGKFFLSLQRCKKTEAGVLLTYDDYVNMMTSGWVHYGAIDGSQALTLLIDLRNYMEGVATFADIIDRLQSLIDLQEVSAAFDEVAKEQTGRHQLKQYLSNPFRSFSYVHRSRYDITIKQLMECTKDLVRKVQRLLLGEREKRNVRVYLHELKQVYDSVKTQWDTKSQMEMEKLFSLSIPEHWEFAKEEMYLFLSLHFGAKEHKHDKILNFDQLTGKALSAEHVHLTGMSFQLFPWKTLELPNVLTYTWMKECIRRSFIGLNQTMRINALLVDYYSRHAANSTAVYALYHLLAFGNETVTFSYIQNWREYDGPSIYFTILQELYGMKETTFVEEENELLWEVPTIEEQSFSVEALRHIPDLLWIDSDFCKRKFFLNALIEHHPVYENDFHQQQAFSIIGRLLSEQGDGEALFRETIFPLFPQWTNAFKQNLLDTLGISGLRVYKQYENIYYPKAMKYLQRLKSKYLVTKNWKARHQYDNDTFKVDEHIRELMNHFGVHEVEAESGIHCRMCPFLHVCKDGEYVIDAANN
jgi:hypothetical protein